MAIDERARHRLHRRLEEVLGPQEAEILMGSLPRTASDELVTKDYLDLRLESVKHELMATFRNEFAHQTRTMVFSFGMMFIGLVGLLLGVHFA